MLEQQVNEESRKANVPWLFLQGISREDVVSAFKCSDAFVFTSQKEVAPLVLLECQVSQLPWVSFDVGDACEQKGGRCIKIKKKNEKNEVLPDKDEIDEFCSELNKILSDNNTELKDEAKVNSKLMNWDNIYLKYKKLFEKGYLSKDE